MIGGGGALGLDPGKLGLGIDHIKGSGEPLTECLVTQPHVLLGQRLGRGERVILLQSLGSLAPGLLDQQLQILAGLGLQQVDLEFGALGCLDRLGRPSRLTSGMLTPTPTSQSGVVLETMNHLHRGCSCRTGKSSGAYLPFSSLIIP